MISPAGGRFRLDAAWHRRSPASANPIAHGISITSITRSKKSGYANKMTNDGAKARPHDETKDQVLVCQSRQYPIANTASSASRKTRFIRIEFSTCVMIVV